MSIDVTREIEGLQNIATPATLVASFTNSARMDQNLAMNVSGVKHENNGRVSVANERVQKIDESIKQIDSVIEKAAAPESPAAGSGAAIATKVAAVGVQLVSAATAAFSGGGSLATMGAGKVFSYARDSIKEGSKADREMSSDYGYDSSKSAPGTFNYSAQQQQAAPPIIGTKADIKAFKGGASRMAKAHGGSDLMEKSEISEQSLAGIEKLKVNLENQKIISEKSLQHAGDIKSTINIREEKGAPVNGDTIEAALKNDINLNDSIKGGAVFHV